MATPTTKQKPQGTARHRAATQTEDAVEQTRRKAAQFALSVLDFEKTTFDNTFKLIDKLQKQTETLVKTYVGKAEWMPEEGRAMVQDWTRMLQSNRREFLKTVDKSFEYMTQYVRRLEEKPQAAKPRSAKLVGATPKKRVVARKAPATLA